MKILVTGGAGFIASHIVDAYVELGHEVIVIDNLSSGREEFVNKKAKFYKVDITDKEKIEKIIGDERPHLINHHAAQISVRDSLSDPQHDAKVNILGLLNLLQAGKENGLKKVIFASSGGVIYGETKVIPTPETYTPLVPLSPYGVSKLAGELYLYFYYKTYGISYLAFRYANVYGPRQNPHGEAGVVAIFTKKILQGETPIINGDGLQTRDYVFVEDVVEVNKLALESSRVGAFNIGTGIETNVIEIYESIKKILKSDIQAIHGPAKMGEQKKSCLDTFLVKKVLGWQAKVDLREGLQKTADYFKKAVSMI